MNLHISPKHGVIGVPLRSDLLNLFPQAKRVTFGGNDLLLVRHGTDETKLLRNLGLPVPTPILAQYDWNGGKPFEIQKKTAAMLTKRSARRAVIWVPCRTAWTRPSRT